MANQITLFSTGWCGYCRRLKSLLERDGIAYREVDLDEHAHHAERIETVTGGYRTVPTIEVAGRLLVNPSIDEVRAAVACAEV